MGSVRILLALAVAGIGGAHVLAALSATTSETPFEVHFVATHPVQSMCDASGCTEHVVTMFVPRTKEGAPLRMMEIGTDVGQGRTSVLLPDGRAMAGPTPQEPTLCATLCEGWAWCDPLAPAGQEEACPDGPLLDAPLPRPKPS